MSREFGLDWKRHDARRMSAFMAIMSEMNGAAARADGDDGRSAFR